MTRLQPPVQPASDIHPQQPARYEGRSQFFAGMKAALVMVPGVFPFGLITGVTALEVGYDIWQTMAMNVLIYAGAAQLAAARMLYENTAVWVIVFTGLVINLRLLLYSASVSKIFAPQPVWQKSLAAYALTDQAYALTIAEEDRVEEDRSKESRVKGAKLVEHTKPNLVAYYFGVAAAMTLTWHISVASGFYFGNVLPSSWSLDFAVPLCFGALVLPHLKDPTNVIVAVVAATLSILLYDLPYNLGLVASGVVGIAVGYFVSQWREPVKP